MPEKNTEEELQVLTNALVDELIAITPGTMSEIQFEIVLPKMAVRTLDCWKTIQM